MAEVYSGGGWRAPREVFLNGAWRVVREAYVNGAWRSVGGLAELSDMVARRDDSSNQAWFTVTIGPGVESIQHRYRLNSGTWTAWSTVNTIPNQGTHTRARIGVANGTRVDFQVQAWTGDAATGVEGSLVEGFTLLEPRPAVSNADADHSDSQNKAWCTFDVNGGTRSVRIEYEITVGGGVTGRQFFQNLDTALGQVGVRSNDLTGLAEGSRVEFYITPYSESGQDGESGSTSSPATTLADETPRITLSGTEAEPVNERVRATFTVNGYTESVRVRYRRRPPGQSFGAWNSLPNEDTTPGGSGATDWVLGVMEGDTIEIELKPYRGNALGGASGPEEVVSYTRPVEANPDILTWDDLVDSQQRKVAATGTVNQDVGSIGIEYSVNSTTNFTDAGYLNVEAEGFTTDQYPPSPAAPGDTIRIRLTPYQFADKGGVSGTQRTVTGFIPTAPTFAPAVTMHNIGASGSSARSTFSVNADASRVDCSYRIGSSGAFTWFDEVTMDAQTEVYATAWVTGASGDRVYIQLVPIASDGTTGPANTADVLLGGGV